MLVRSIILVLSSIAALPFATAAEYPAKVNHKSVLTLATAEQIAARARKIAADNDWPCAVAIVDDGGWPILSTRMDGAPVVAGIELAEGKARTSAIFKRPSSDLESSINSGRQAAITSGFVMMKGGQPITLDGEVVGAIGISADTPSHDDEIAIAAVNSVHP